MKKNIYVLILALISLGAFAQTHEIHTELGQAWGGGASVDINADGHLDFYIAGNPDGDTSRWNRMAFYNPSTKKYDSIGTNLQVTDRVNLDWYDVDGDGKLDLLGTEHSWSYYNGGVYKNEGDGQFTKLDWPIPNRTMAGAFADFNNDGMIDYVCISNDSLGSCVMINKGDGTFDTTNVGVFDGLFFGLGYVEVLDYNNDGLMDFFLSANVDNDVSEARVISDIFINYDEAPGSFFRAFLGKTDDNPGGSIYMKGNGGVDFADFNSDGWIDMALYGEGGRGTLEPAGGGWECITHTYMNAKDGTFTDKAQPAINTDLRPLSSTGVGTGVIDWDMDGDYDLIVTGWNPTIDTQVGFLYSGDGAGNFTDEGRIPGGSETVVLFNDWNDDGVYDYLVSGHSWDPMWYTDGVNTGRTASVFFNTNTTTANVKPSAPTNLAATLVEDMLTLSWDASTDDLTPAVSLSYEFFLKDGDDKFIVAPASMVGGDKDGFRMLVKHGNAYLNKFAIINDLPHGSYTWGVQAIDASYAGSAFATGTFNIVAASVSNVVVTDLADIYSSNEMLVVRGKSYDRAKVEVFNLIGQQIISERVDNNFNTHLPKGIYIVKVSSENRFQVGKVHIQ